MKPDKGFSLAEILIALTLLGIIAVFAIPKILLGTEERHKITVFKQALSTISQIQTEGMTTGKLQCSNFSTYFISKINAAKNCPNNSVQEGCWDASRQAQVPPDMNEPGVLLHSGAAIVGFSSCSGPVSWPWRYNGFWIDWNGVKGPNTRGEDLMGFTIAYGTQPVQIGQVHMTGNMGNINPIYGTTTQPGTIDVPGPSVCAQGYPQIPLASCVSVLTKELNLYNKIMGE